MAQPLLLIYNLDAPTEARLNALCDRQGIRVRRVEPWQFALPIGALAGIPAGGVAAPMAGEAFADPMLVMCHMLSPQLDAFLRGMRDEGLPRVALKAVLTPDNVAWSSRRLRDELAREHEAILKKGAARKGVR